MKDKVIEVVARILNLPPNTVTLESSPATLKNWDSIHHIELVLALEQEFGVQFSAIALTEQTTVGRLCEEIRRLQGR